MPEKGIYLAGDGVMTFQPSLQTLCVGMPTFDQDWSLVRWTGAEAVCELFEFRAVMVAKSSDRQWLALDDHLGQRIHLTIRDKEDREEVRHFHGVVRHAAELPNTPAGRSVVEWTIAPSVWLLSINRRCRVFQGETAPKILATVLEGFDVVFNLADDYAPHNYCVQYLESDFSFACRLMEESGIYYYFEHNEKGHRLVLSDRSRECPSVAGDEGVVRFNPTVGAANVSGCIREWRRSQSLCPNRWTSRDHHYELQQPILDASEQTTDYSDEVRKRVRFHHGDRLAVHGRQRQQDQSQTFLEVFEYPAGVAHRFDPLTGTNGLPTPIEPIYDEHRRRERYRSESAAAAAVVVEGAGDSVRLVPGAGFNLKGHGPADDRYFITRVEHSIQLPLPEAANDVGETYANRFRVIPAALPFRPRRRSPTPTMAGAQTALVVGPPGEEIHTDNQGRIKIQFHWDRAGVRDGGSSCWVRVAQPWSGKNYGFFALPRVGTEVLVEFEDGDPDQPIVVGCVYNANQPAPFEMPFDRTMTGLKTRTYRGENEDFHGMYFDDANGSEMVRIRSQKDVLLEAKSEVVVAAPNGLTSLANGFHLSMTGGFLSVAGSGSGGAAGPIDAAQYSSEMLTGVSYVGSGAGGGNSAAVMSKQQTGGWLNVSPTVNGTSPFVVSIAAVLGVSGQINTGLRFVYNLPGSTQVWVDPFTAFGVMSQFKGGWLTGAAGMLGLTGNNQILYASTANITYGGEFKVRRGPAFESTDSEGGWSKSIAAVHGACVTAASVIPFTSVNPTQSSWSTLASGSSTGLAQLLQWLLFAVERRTKYVKKKWYEDQEGIDLLSAAIAQAGEGNSDAAVSLRLLSEKLFSEELAHNSASKTESAQGRYMITSTKNSVVILAAEGVGIASGKGSVKIGENNIVINCADDAPILTRSKHLIAKTSTDGVIYLGSGHLAHNFGDVASTHDNSAFCFQADKSAVRMKRKSGPKVEEILLDEGGVSIRCQGDGGTNTVKISKDGIKLNVDGFSTLSLTKDEIELKAPKVTIAANTAFTIKGAQIKHQN